MAKVQLGSRRDNKQEALVCVRGGGDTLASGEPCLRLASSLRTLRDHDAGTELHNGYHQHQQLSTLLQRTIIPSQKKKLTIAVDCLWLRGYNEIRRLRPGWGALRRSF